MQRTVYVPPRHTRAHNSWTAGHAWFSPVGHTDVGYISPSDVIPSRTIFLVVLANPVLLHLYTAKKTNNINKRTQKKVRKPPRVGYLQNAQSCS